MSASGLPLPSPSVGLRFSGVLVMVVVVEAMDALRQAAVSCVYAFRWWGRRVRFLRWALLCRGGRLALPVLYRVKRGGRRERARERGRT
jgi:hypothetical protein